MITFIATAYREKNEVNMFVNSLLLQTNPNWKLIIYCDEYNEYIINYIYEINDNRIYLKYNENTICYWGHFNRIDALNYVETDFVIQTSIQDYYIPNTIKYLSNLFNFDFVYFNALHHNFNYDILNTELKRCRIDWGCFMVRTNIAKEVGIKNPKSSICDGLYVEDLINYNNIKIHKFNKILTIHN